MLIVLPFLTLAAIVFLLRSFLGKRFDLRLVILAGGVLWGFMIALMSELLSMLHLFNQAGMAVGWGLLLIAAASWSVVRWRRQAGERLLPQFGLLEWFHLAGIGGIALITGAIALIAAPNNWDSMVYHLSRAMHWLQNGSLSFYPTNIVRQLYLPPWSETLLAHMLALGESDRFVQIPQWLAMLGSVMGVSLLAKQLGARPAGQLFSAFAAATIPMGILQSTTTQNDYILTFWLVCLAVFIQHSIKAYQPMWNLAIGGALGLALLTKSTAFIFGLPFMLAYGVWVLKRFRLHFWKPVLVISLIVLLLNLPHFTRNFTLFSHPLGPQAEVARYHNQTISMRGTLSNIIRNLGLYLGTVEPVNQVLDEGIREVHNWMDLDLNDPRFTWSDHRFSVASPRAHEDTTGSGLHLLLFSAAFVFLVIKRRMLPSRMFILFGLLLLSAFLVFSLYLRWQVWHPRLHLPLLVMASAWVGLLEQVVHQRFIWLTSLALGLTVLPVLYFNASRPLVADYTIFNLPRREVMIMRKNLVVPAIEGVNYLLDQNCYDVGLYIPNEEWEYPFWSLYRDSGMPYRMEHINVSNPSGKLPLDPFTPCGVIATSSTGEQFEYGDGVYDLGWSMAPVYIYTK